MNILILRHAVEGERRQLFTLIGEYFACPKIRREFGRPMSSGDDYVWFVAVDADRAIAFAALRVRNGKAEMCHAYTLPEWRRQGINSALVAERLQWADRDLSIRQVFTIMKPVRAPKYAPMGFVEHRKRGQYSCYIRERVQ